MLKANIHFEQLSIAENDRLKFALTNLMYICKPVMPIGAMSTAFSILSGIISCVGLVCSATLSSSSCDYDRQQFNFLYGTKLICLLCCHFRCVLAP